MKISLRRTLVLGSFLFTIRTGITEADGAKSAPITPGAATPISFQYEMPYDGFVAIQIFDKAHHKLVRRLVAEVARSKGLLTETWDGRDDAGQYAAPGEYAWKGIARPPLKLTYQYTVNNAGQPAWWAPKPGKGGGGWMSDHSVPHEVCAVGDAVFLSAEGGENGHALIAVDRAGNKLWGVGAPFGPFSGVMRMAGDGRYCYAQLGTSIMRIDPANDFARTNLGIDYNFSRALPAPAPVYGSWGFNGGLAARGDNLYLTVHANGAPWIASAFTPADIAGSLCNPPVVNSRRAESYGEGWTEVERFHAAFFDGGAVNSVDGQGYGEATKTGPLAHTLTVVYKTPVALGSVLLPDTRIKVYGLKPGAKLGAGQGGPGEAAPGDPADDTAADPFDPTVWQLLPAGGASVRPGLALPGHGFKTTALRFATDHLPYALVMDRRFADVAPAAERFFSEGKRTSGGGWRVSRDSKTRPISEEDPAAVTLAWQEPVKLRGISLLQPDTAFWAVDVWQGAGEPGDNLDAKIAAVGSDGWQQVGSVQAGTRGPRPTVPLAHHFDFGAVRTTRAVRVRAMLPSNSRTYMGNISPVSGSHDAGFESVVAYSPLGSDVDFPAEMTDRVLQIHLPADPTKEKCSVTANLPVEKPGYLTFGPGGELYAESANRIITVPLDGTPGKILVTAGALQDAAGMCFDAAGTLYVCDRAAQNIKVFDGKTGTLLRTIGHGRGGTRVGPWDPNCFLRPYGLALDSAGKLWLADQDTQPKRVARFDRDGKFEADFFGPAFYGGGGHLDPADPSILYYYGMKFVADQPHSTFKLESIVYNPWAAECVQGGRPDRPFYYQGHRYLLGDTGGFGSNREGALICLEKDGQALALAGAGNLAGWGAEINKRADLKAKFGKYNKADFAYLWLDANGDHIPQVDEVQTTQADKFMGGYWGTSIGEDLSLNFNGARLPLSGMRPDGAPLYDLSKLQLNPKLNSLRWTVADGSAFVMHEGEGAGDNYYLAADGKDVLWTYPDNYSGVHGSHNIGYDRPAGTVVGELHPAGHLQVGDEDLFVTNGNHGDWFAYTKDGLLAATIFGGPAGYGKRSWSMPEWDWGKTDLSDLTVGEEHFGGSIIKAADNHVYAVAGHNHNSVVRVDGLELMKRISGTVTASKAAIDAAMSGALTPVGPVAAKTARMPHLRNALFADADLTDWDASLFVPIQTHLDNKNKTVVDCKAALAYDDDNLYIGARLADDSPAQNNAEEPKYLFKGGDALDVNLGLDPAATANRTSAATGDVRIMLARWKGKPAAVVYRYVVPGTPDANRQQFLSPISNTTIDVVTVIDNPKMAVAVNPNEWVVEAAIPWKSLGAHPPATGMKIRGDVGVLQSDDNGQRTLRRYYWSGKSQTIVSDMAYESRISPNLWGQFATEDAEKGYEGVPDAPDLLGK